MGSSFVEKAEALFKSKGLGFDIKLFEENLNNHLIDWRDYLHGIKVKIKISKNRSKADILKEHQSRFNKIFAKTCTETYLEQSRIELSKWINDVQKGRAL